MTAEERIDARVRALNSAGNLVPSQAAPPSGVRALEQAVQNNGGKVFGAAAAQPEVHYPFSNLTICVVTCKEHSHFIPDLLHSTMPLQMQGASIVVLHTEKGEIERAVKLATEERNTVAKYTYTGIFNYGRAKNLALDCVLTEWVLFLDSDERLCLDTDAVLDVINTPNLDAVYCKVQSIYSPNKDISRCVMGEQDVILSQDVIDPAIRLFKPNNHVTGELQRYRFTEGTHEQIKPSIVERSGMVSDSAIRIFHIGYKNPIDNFKKTMKRLQGLAKDLEVNSNTEDYHSIYRLWMLFAEIDTIAHLREMANSKMRPMNGAQVI